MLTRTIITTFFLIGFLLNIVACSQKTEVTQATFYVFGTMVEISIYDPDQNKTKKAIAEVEQQFQKFHHEWHAWEKGGIVAKINQAIHNQKSIDVSDSVKQFILKSQMLSQQSQGLFDPAIGELVNLWGFHKEEWQGPPPSELEIQSWLNSSPSINDLQFTGNLLYSSNPDVQLDFGGNAKGLAIDMAMQTLKEKGINNALVSIGGDMKVIGNKPEEAWRIGIQSPIPPHQALAKIKLKPNESIVTSGDYQRFFEWQGQKYSHIINPKTGYPANTFSSVTVIHKDAITADAAATAILVAGPEHWQEIAHKMNITAVLCITHDGQYISSPKMEKRLQLLNKQS